MEKKKREFFGKKLIEEKERILNLLEKIKNPEEAGFVNEYSIELSSYDNHPADLGTEMFMMEQDKGLINKFEDILYEIENSIRDLESDKYGFCISCEKEIGIERLKLIPYLKECVDCSKKKIPLDKKRNFRPEEEDSIIGLKNDIKEGNLFDREDSYQAVARHNKIDNDPSFSTGDDIGIFDDEEIGIVEDVEKISQKYFDDTNK